jgi:16S rRNA (cytidine1402-2'-O)-methyltransferase
VLCATPIGNLSDASLRLAEALSSVDVVYAEDTRRARTLLDAIGVNRPLRSFFVGNERERSVEIGRRLSEGGSVGLITDAGTPAVSDPGVSAVGAARSVGAAVTIVPGPSAVTSAIAVSGFPADRFVFEGFLPRKGSERRKRLSEMAGELRTMVVFTSPHRAVEDFDDLASALGPDREVCVVRELTKLHEEVVWMSVTDAALEWSRREPRGEFTLVVAGGSAPEPDLDFAVSRARELMEEGVPPSAAARQAAAETGAERRSLYRGLQAAD